MMRSMYAAITGMRSHQTYLDVVGNNISNVNTTGFKASRVTFEDLLSQTLRGAGVNADTGGTNPAQVGLGVKVSAISRVHTQGALQATGVTTDLAILGDGFFALRTPTEVLYSRAGAFNLDAQGRIVDGNGNVLQGWMADNTGAVDPNQPIQDLVVPVGGALVPNPTSTVLLGGLIPADAAVGYVVTRAADVYDDQGVAVPLTFSWTKTAANTWQLDIDDPGGTISSTSVSFNPTTGEPTPGSVTIPAASFTTGTWTNPVVVDFAVGDPAGVLQFAGGETFTVRDQDGYSAGVLTGFSISPAGTINGTYSNGRTLTIGQVALVNFNNPVGLESVGQNLLRVTVNSGLPQVGLPNTGGRGALTPGAVEMSNVDLATEFTNLITAQRGFQANTRVVTSSDELLAEIVNLKR